MHCVSHLLFDIQGGTYNALQECCTITLCMYGIHTVTQTGLNWPMPDDFTRRWGTLGSQWVNISFFSSSQSVANNYFYQQRRSILNGFY